MGLFPGGSAFAMARQVADGYMLVTERTYQRLAVPQLDALSFELEKLLRQVRAEPVPTEDTLQLQQRNRRLQRLTGARQMLEIHRRKRRR